MERGRAPGFPQGLKPGVFLVLAARLKSCPSRAGLPFPGLIKGRVGHPFARFAKAGAVRPDG
jgi:hypothetical protein